MRRGTRGTRRTEEVSTFGGGGRRVEPAGPGGGIVIGPSDTDTTTHNFVAPQTSQNEQNSPFCAPEEIQHGRSGQSVRCSGYSSCVRALCRRQCRGLPSLAAAFPYVTNGSAPFPHLAVLS